MKILGLLLMILLTAPKVFAGNEGPHGGDTYALEFNTIGTELGKYLASLQERDPSLFMKWKFSAKDFQNAVSSVRVVSKDSEDMQLKGQTVDAINDPGRNLIMVNRERWREDDLLARTKLVLHEYFGILAVEQDRYDASRDFSDFVTQAAKSIASDSASGVFLANLFYGRCVSIANLDDVTTCEVSSPKIIAAQSCAVTQAQGMCELSGKTNCDLVNISYSARLSATQIGLRYCEVLVILK